MKKFKIKIFWYCPPPLGLLPAHFAIAHLSPFSWAATERVQTHFFSLCSYQSAYKGHPTIGRAHPFKDSLRRGSKYINIHLYIYFFEIFLFKPCTTLIFLCDRTQVVSSNLIPKGSTRAHCSPQEKLWGTKELKLLRHFYSFAKKISKL